MVGFLLKVVEKGAEHIAMDSGRKGGNAEAFAGFGALIGTFTPLGPGTGTVIGAGAGAIVGNIVDKIEKQQEFNKTRKMTLAELREYYKNKGNT